MFNLETDRLLLRSFQLSDLDDFVTYRSDPEVARYQSWEAPYSREAGVALIQEMMRKPGLTSGEWYQIAIQLKENSKLIGDCAVHLTELIPTQAEIGFTLSRSYQGKGYAREAVHCLLEHLFQDLHLHRVSAICDAENRSAARLLAGLGMRQEGYFLENIWFKGQWGSEYAFALLQREWKLSKS